MDIIDVAARLERHLRDLSEQRGADQSVHMLEAFGAGVDEEALWDCVRAQLERHPRPDACGWDDCYLALLYAASECGYQYSGEEYWPEFERRVGASFDGEQPRALSRRFEQAARALRLARPPATEWASHFRHIAWPITNAVMPRDLQEQVARTLARVHFPIDHAADPRALADHLIAASRGFASSRFEQWLATPDLVLATSLALVGRAESTWLDDALAARIRRDVESDHSRKRLLDGARANSREANRRHDEARADRAERAATVGKLALVERPDDGELTLFVSLPQLSDAHLRAARATGARVRPWGLGRARVERLFSGQPVELAVRSLPPHDEHLCAPDELPAELRPLAAATLDARPPLAFEAPTGEDEEHWWSTRRPRGDRPLLVLGDAQTVATPPASVADEGSFGALRRWRVHDPRDEDALAWLEALDLSSAAGRSFAWVGGPSTDVAGGRAWWRSEPVVLLSTAASRAEVEGAGMVNAAPGELLQLAEPKSGASLRVTAAGDDDEHLVIVRQPPTGQALPFYAEACGPLTLRAAREGALTLRVHASALLEDVWVSADLRVDGQVRVAGRWAQPTLPAVLGPSRFKQLLHDVAADRPATLTVRLEGRADDGARAATSHS